MDSNPLLSFQPIIVSHEWEHVPGTGYMTSYFLFTLKRRSLEYRLVKSHFNCTPIPVSCIQRIQHPFQISQYMFKRNVSQYNYESILFHRVHREDLDIALKFNCDYKQYQKKHQELYKSGVHPKFYNSYKDLLKATIRYGVYPLNDIVVLVVKSLTTYPQSEYDNFIQYIVKF